jgi:hypothetical protein
VSVQEKRGTEHLYIDVQTFRVLDSRIQNRDNSLIISRSESGQKSEKGLDLSSWC